MTRRNPTQKIKTVRMTDDRPRGRAPMDRLPAADPCKRDLPNLNSPDVHVWQYDAMSAIIGVAVTGVLVAMVACLATGALVAGWVVSTTPAWWWIASGISIVSLSAFGKATAQMVNEILFADEE